MLRHEIEGTTTDIARQRKKLVFKGDQARTDNRTIVLPELDATTCYDPRSARLLKAYAYHEAAHCRYTDWKALEANSRAARSLAPGTAGQSLQALQGWMANVFDDCAIERLLREEFPGTYVPLDALRAHTAQARAGELAASGEGPPMEPAMAAQLAMMAVANLSNDWGSAPDDRAALGAVRGLYPRISALVEGWEPALRGLATSTEAIDFALASLPALAEALAAERDSLPDPATPEDAQPGPGRGDGAGEAGSKPSDAPSGDAGGQGGAPGPTPGDGEGAAVEDPPQDSPEAPAQGAGDPPAGTDGGPEPTGDAEPGEAPGSDGSPQGEPDGPCDDAKKSLPAEGDGDEGEASQSGDGAAAEDGPSGPSGPPPAPAGSPSAEAPEEKPASGTGSIAGPGDSAAPAGAATIRQGALEALGQAVPGQLEASPTDASAAAASIAATTEAGRRGRRGHGAPLAAPAILSFHVREATHANPLYAALADNSDADFPDDRSTLDAADPDEALVAREMRRMLIGQSNDRIRRYCEEGELDVDDVAGLATGASGVFMVRTAATMVDTALLMVIDASASTSAITGTLSRIAFRIAGLETSTPRLRTAIVTYTTARQSPRRDDEVPLVLRLKDFSEHMTAARRNFGKWTLARRIMRATPTAEGMLAGARLLEARPESKKVMMVVTDGEANDPEAVGEVVRHLRARRIEPCVLEIGNHRAPRTPCARVALAPGIGQVAEALRRMVREALADRGR